MELFVYIVVSAFLLAIGVWFGATQVKKQEPKKNYAGTLLIYMQDDEAYLFLDTDKKPADLISEKEAVFQIKVETHDPQSPL